MQRISRRNTITPESIPDAVADLIIRRFDQLIEESDGEAIPIIIPI